MRELANPTTPSVPNRWEKMGSEVCMQTIPMLGTPTHLEEWISWSIGDQGGDVASSVGERHCSTQWLCELCPSYPETCKPHSELISGDLLRLVSGIVKLFTALHNSGRCLLLNTKHGLDLGKVIHWWFCSLYTFRTQPVLTLSSLLCANIYICY